MAWNDPGGKDPWGGANKQPPDMDAVFKDLLARYQRFFGGDPNRSLVLGIVALLVLAWAALGIYQVDAKEKAVVLRFGKYLETVGDGLHWNPPLVDSVTKIRVTEERQYQTRGEMLTQDENIVELPLTVHYNVSDVKAFALNVKDPEKSLTQATDSALRHVVGSSKLDDVVSTGREQLSVDVKTRLQTYLDNYGTGIHVVKVNILEAKPPAEVKSAYDDVIKAREDQERLVNEAQGYANGIIPEARGHAQRLIEEANGYRSRVVAEAEGQSQRFEQLLTEYRKAPEVTRQRLYLDSMEAVMASSSKVLVDVEGGNNMLYLPLDKLVSQQGAKPAEATNMTPAEISSIADQVIEKLRSQTTSVQRREPRE
ncbi:MAG: FtsH protease activity modulator HflK [Porticoccaceae bacterium]